MKQRLTKDYKEHLFERLQSPSEIVGYLSAALEDGDATFWLALKDVIEAQEQSGGEQ